MKPKPAIETAKSQLWAQIKSKIKYWINRTKALNGEPRYVAMGMAVGIFVSATPTIPFQTFIAVTMAFILRGSKSAAAIGVWLSNPVTLPVFYLASYKTGALLLGISNGTDITGHTTTDLLKLGFDISLAAMTGGIVIGIILAIGAYFITRKIVTKIRSREKKLRMPHLRGKKKEGGRQQTKDRGQIAQASDTASSDPDCEYATAILCQPTTEEERPRT
jgi:uncharacterized protein (DUF2062 family)